MSVSLDSCNSKHMLKFESYLDEIPKPKLVPPGILICCFFQLCQIIDLLTGNAHYD